MSRPLAFATPLVEVEDLPGGARLIRSGIPLGCVPETIFVWLDRWAAERPDGAFITETGPGPTREVLTYSVARDEVERLASHLRRVGITPGDRVVVAAPNSIRHLLWGLAVMRCGAIYVPMAPQYVGAGHDREKLVGLFEMLDPTLTICPPGQKSAVPGRWRSTELASLDAEFADDGGAETTGELPTLEPDDITKILLTSGSTGLPKPVPYSQRQMTTAVSMMIKVWAFVLEDPPVLLDWLPWNHAFGGTANLHLVLATGGTMHIDAGGPGPDGLTVTLADLPALRPSVFFAVPATLDLLRSRLESDRRSAEEFFSSVRMVFSAGAALSADTFYALRTLSEECRHPVTILSGWGSTETGPGATMVHVEDSGPGWIGTPLPGVEIKLTPEGGKWHASVRGPNVFRGYWGAVAPKDAFDADGFYPTGDAACLVDPARPERGLRFDGRIADDFKLANGTWVDYARIRGRLIEALDGRVVDLVLGLPDGPALTALAWTADGGPLPAPWVDVVLERYNAGTPRPTDRVVGLSSLATPPSPEEISPKGQLRPAEVRRSRRSEFVAQLSQRKRPTA